MRFTRAFAALSVYFTTWLVVFQLVGGSQAIAQVVARRTLTPKETLQLSWFSGENPDLPLSQDDSQSYSPDGRYFAFLTHRGIFPSGEEESTLWLFDIASVRRFLRTSAATPSPLALVRMASAQNGDDYFGSHGETIYRIRWAADGRSLYFLGYDKAGNRHIFQSDLHQNSVRQLTPNNQDVTDFAPIDGTVLYIAKPGVHEGATWVSADKDLPDIEDITGKQLWNVLWPNWERNYLRHVPAELWEIPPGKEGPTAISNGSSPVQFIEALESGLIISPDHRYVALRTYAPHISTEWENYALGPGPGSTPIAADDSATKDPFSDVFRAEQYQLIDLTSGRMRPLFDAPTAGFDRGYQLAIPKLAWSPNSARVAISGTYLPLSKVGTRGAFSIVVFNLATGAVEYAVPFRQLSPDWSEASDIHWSNNREFSITYTDRDRRKSESEDFVKGKLGWIMRSIGSPVRAPQSFSPIVFETIQALDAAPALVAVDAENRQEKKIFDPNAWLDEIDLGTAKPYHWQDSHGDRITGGLILPPDYLPGQRYPLVVSTHGGFDSDKFLVTGPNSPIRSIAAKGIVVLQVNEPRTYRGQVGEDIYQGADVYASAIDNLVKDGIADRSRVGIIGTSRTAIYVATTLFRYPDKFAAAAFVSGGSQNYADYLMTVDYTGKTFNKEYAGFVGPEPFGEGLQRWVKDSFGFNTDRVAAPLLIQADNPLELSYAWPDYAALRQQNKPVDLLYFRTSTHPPRIPRHRLSTFEAQVDWFSFWLKGDEDHLPAKREQYARWEGLCDLQRTQNPSRPTFCVPR